MAMRVTISVGRDDNVARGMLERANEGESDVNVMEGGVYG